MFGLLSVLAQLARDLPELGGHRPGLEHEHIDAARRELDPECFAEQQIERLARGVDTVEREGLSARNRAREDHCPTATLLHARHDAVAENRGRDAVDLHHLLHALARDLVEAPRATEAGVVDQDADLEILDRARHEIRASGIGEVGGDNACLHAMLLLELGGEIRQPLLPARRQHDVHAVARQGPRELHTEPRRGARHDPPLAVAVTQ